MKFNNQQHTFHLVDPSPWPLTASFSLLCLTAGGVMYMHYYNNAGLVLTIGFFTLLATLICWWRDVIREGTFLGNHSKKVQKGLRLGMALFIVSEVMFFLAFFWAYFHSSLAPTIEIGSVWPPVGIEPFSPFQIPLLNTIILLLSGATITMAHHALILFKKDNETIDVELLSYNSKKEGYIETQVVNLPLWYYLDKQIRNGFLATIGLAVLFTLLQVYEYFEAPFSINSGIYGSTFFMATGFHGFHVIVGTIFIVVNYFRYKALHFTSTDHFGFEASIWYWHFVDVVWLILYLSIYIWPTL